MDFSKDIPSHIDHDGKKYDIVYLFLRCQKWNLSLPETIEDVIIDRTLSGNSSYDRNHLFGDSKNSKFSVEKSKFFYSENGSLYSYDKKVLYHFYNGNDNNIVDSVELIAPNAIYNPGCISLSIPIDVKEIKKNAIIGGFKEVDFKGKLVSIENGALDNIKNYGNNILKIKINGLVSDLTTDSRNELKKWFHSNEIYRNIIFAVPKNLPQSQVVDGYIHLAGVIETNCRHYDENRLDYGKDYKEITINAYINESIGNSRVPIVVEEVLIKNMYETNYLGSRILFFAKDENNREGIPYIEVFDKKVDIEKKIEQAIKQMRN